MKVLFSLSAILLFFSSCTTFNSQLPTPPAQAYETNFRGVASSLEDIEAKYITYFDKVGFYQKVTKLEALTNQLYVIMPDKGNSKKKLVAKFLTDLRKEVAALAAYPSSKGDTLNAWLPSTNLANYNDKILALGRIAQSYKIMTQMGIYLTASGVFEKDTNDEDFYLSLLDRATYDIENGLRDLMLVYKPEIKDAQENGSRLSYSRTLATDVRLALRKVYQMNAVGFKQLDQFFLKVANVPNVAEAKKLIKTADFNYAKTAMQSIHVMNSGDIDGFADEMDLTVATKFNFEMINQLISSAR